MSELLKDKYYHYDFLRDLAARIKSVYSPFDVELFCNGVMDAAWGDLGLKARARRIALHLGSGLPPDYEEAIGVLEQVLQSFPKGRHDNALICLPDFVEVYGQAECHWDASMAALEKFTIFSTSEFAVRPWIANHENRMMRQMAIWAGSDNEHVRRLASEGCRPRLPWGQALRSFQKDPSPILEILEQLKADPSPYVRKSVANNLNDISKTHPDLIVSLARRWYGTHRHTDWIVKHGCRTLLKRGNREALDLLGLGDTDRVRVNRFAVDSPVVYPGGNLTFSVNVIAERDGLVRLEYGIDYAGIKGKRTRKIFRLSEIALRANQEKTYVKTHSMADLSTRKHYPGSHTLTLLVNGAERGALDFELRTDA